MQVTKQGCLSYENLRFLKLHVNTNMLFPKQLF